MLDRAKEWFANNKKLAMYGGIVIAIAYFGYKYWQKNKRARKLTRRTT